MNDQEKPNRIAADAQTPEDFGPLRLTNDFLFKRIFGSRRTQDVLLTFVDAVLADAGMPTAIELTITNPELPRDASWLKTAVLDIAAVDTSGRAFDIEVQVAKRPAFAERRLLSEHLSIHFLELGKDLLPDSSLGTWMRYIDSEGVMEDRRAHEEYKKVIEDPQERHWAWARQVFQMDRNGEIIEARREGREEGRAEGAHKQAVTTARRFLEMGLSPAQVAAGTGLPLDEVEGLSSSDK